MIVQCEGRRAEKNMMSVCVPACTRVCNCERKNVSGFGPSYLYPFDYLFFFHSVFLIVVNYSYLIWPHTIIILIATYLFLN